MRSFPAISCALALASLLLGVLPSCTSNGTTEACAPGQQVACACAGGEHGVQVCRDDSTGYGPCTSCSPSTSGDASPDGAEGDARADGMDDAPDASADGGTDAPDDADAPDADAGADTGTGGSPPTNCIYPTDSLDGQPTDGNCQGNTAFTCDPTSHQMVGTPCSASEVCTVYQVSEHPDSATGRTYAWAACLPEGAAPCSYAWSEFSYPSYPQGEWTTTYAGNCQGNAALTCTMAPVPFNALYFGEWAGTTTGYVTSNQCASDEQCAQNPMAPQLADCYASPLVPCLPEANSSCDGDMLHDCFGNPYQKLVDCTATGQICRQDCPQGPYQPAECRDPLPTSAVACDPSSFTNSCNDPATLVRCDDCFEQGGQCVCYTQAHACSDVYCGIDSSACQCADVVGQGGQCIVDSDTLCDPASTPDTCQGSVAQTCIGYLSDLDCSQYGEICTVASGHAGCIGSPATPCDASLVPTCNGNVITACCPASGQYENPSYPIPCAPGYEVTLDCGSLRSGTTPLTCESYQSGATCFMQ